VRPRSYVARGELTSPKWCRAFAAGCGGDLVDHTHLVDLTRPMALFGSVKLWDSFTLVRCLGHEFYYGDHAYFRRFEFYRVTRNALMHDGTSGEPDYARLRALGVKIRPWRPGGRHVLVCPPDKAFGVLHGFDADVWLADVLEQLAAATDRPIRVRTRLGAETRPRSLLDDLRGCHALVTYTSNAAVEALLEGVPVICTAQCSASAMGISDPGEIESVTRPDGREAWAARLAANQWTLAEIAQGDCWRAIGEE
jgi:hypothetical protein